MIGRSTTTCDACGRRYEFTNHKDRCPCCCPKPEPDDAFEEYELSDEVYDDDDSGWRVFGDLQPALIITTYDIASDDGVGMLEAIAKGGAIDPADPPVFESQAAYLDRHKLLTEEERECLPADAFVPIPYQDTN